MLKIDRVLFILAVMCWIIALIAIKDNELLILANLIFVVGLYANGD